MPWNGAIFPFFGMPFVLSPENLPNLLVFFVKFDGLVVAELDGAEAVGEKKLGSKGVTYNCNG